ncbi:response regulator [Paramagnetospirillum marisnigri]|uniref:Response regulator n=1 Tax=Paramagnetospirillum marisnigri TaxID=1285242 RepID=A0A178MHS4_9PROT|nr:response regulator [Paramagnetospirillum marisnigri]OAN48113.1 response regulator [Paramagnetospirillum marisnigri]
MSEKGSSAFLVFLAEDDPGDANLVKTAFQEGGYSCQIEHAWDGAELMLMLKSALDSGARLPDLLVLDINMPRKNGIEVLSEVKADAALRDIPVVMLTTSEADRDVAKAYQTGASGYVSKPVDVDSLFNLIKGIEDYWFGTMRRPR